MRIIRVVVRNLRVIEFCDIPLQTSTTLVIGENNAGKSTLIHALRLCLDVGLSSAFRQLNKDDIHCGIDQQLPFHVLVGVEFTAFEGHENEEALLHGTQIAPDRARLFYRFRPKRAVREALEQDPLGRPLVLDDFGWELRGGGNPSLDLTQINWSDDIGEPVGLQYLQSYLVVFLPALRDVEQDLQQSRRSSLMQLIEASNIPLAEQRTIVDVVSSANSQIESSPGVREVATSIDRALAEISGPAFALNVDLGLSSPNFQSVIRNLILLLSTATFSQFEPRRNGLGLNNMLYIAILIEQFRKRSTSGNAAGELILIEEPEAHLHPQLQSTLMDALRALPFQIIATTHSTQITAGSPLSSYVVMTQQNGMSPRSAVPSLAPTLTANDQADLERYLDATKSNLLFARRVMLVEGAAELLLLPSLIKKVLNVDLEREGISLVAIHGTHFAAFSKLFSANCLPKRCAIVADADQNPTDTPLGDDVPIQPNLAILQGPFVKVFLGQTTFEREITVPANFAALAAAATELGAPNIATQLAMWGVVGGDIEELKNKVLRTSKRFGKGRFAQLAARHIGTTCAVPPYIVEAVAWLVIAHVGSLRRFGAPQSA